MRTLEQMNTSKFTDETDLQFYGTVNDDGTPHITVFNSMFLLDPNTVVWGEYCHGYSKINQKKRQENTVLTLSSECRVATLRVSWDHEEISGEVLDRFNRVPRFRYNNLWGYSPVHFLTLHSHTEEAPLEDCSAQQAASAAAASKIYPGSAPDAISQLTRQYFEAESSFKVMGWVDKDGTTAMAPIPQGVLTTANRVVFAIEQQGAPYQTMADNTIVAVYAIQLCNMQSVLVKGPLQRRSIDGAVYGVIDIETVYSPMMPKNDYIYPRGRIEPVRQWENTVYEFNV